MKLFFRLLFTLILTLAFISPEYSSENRAYLETEILSKSDEAAIAKLFTREKTQQIDSLVQLVGKRYRYNGCIAVGLGDELIVNRALGTADFSHRRKMKANDIFQLASVSKQFTAMAIMICQEEGLLDYDDPVKKFIPDFTYEKATIRQCLNHTAGLPNYMWLLEHKWESDSIIPYNDDVLRMMADHELSPYFRPGRKFDYSNTGYMVLASVVEAVSGQLFADFMQERVFGPLGMTNSFVYSRALDRPYPEHLKGHYRRWRSYRIIEETLHDGLVGDKNVYSTTADLFKWDQALYTNQLVSFTTLEQAFTPFKLRNRWEKPYGFGFRIRKQQGHKVIYHHGRWEGFRTGLMRYVEEGKTIIVLNHTNFSASSILINRIKRVLDEGPDYTKTRELVQLAINHGTDEAIEQLERQQAKDAMIKIYPKKLKEIQTYLSAAEKPSTAKKMETLYQYFISRTA